jgi:hypothetical protein
MITIKPIENAAIDLFNDGRFYGELDGFVVSDGEKLCGHSLFRIEYDVTVILEARADDDFLFDGIMRASIAKGDKRGAHSFICEEMSSFAEKWHNTYCENYNAPISNHIILNHNCS